MLSIVKGVSRNRNISELAITVVVTHVNRDSELHCSCSLVGETFGYLLACIITVCFMLLHCTLGP